MKENRLELRAQYADTDAYGVVWHGSYLRWMEQGRVDFLRDNGLEIEQLRINEGIVMPVIELNIKYKYSAKAMDKLVLVTKLIELTKTSAKFSQEIIHLETGKTCTVAEVKALALKDNKIMKNLDELLGV